MTYNASTTDRLDHHMPDAASVIGGRSAAPVKQGLPQAPRMRKVPRQARARTDHDGIKAFMLDFTVSAAKTAADESHEGIAPATRDFLKAASFLMRT